MHDFSDRAIPLLMTACFLLTGCAGEPAPYQPPLEGVFLWEDGKEPRELEGATVEFESQGAVVASTGIVGDGTFLLGKALPPGEYRVRIQPSPAAAGVLHPRYQEFGKSGLSYTAAADPKPQQVNFKIAKAGR
jgi:hypothetical protein